MTEMKAILCCGLTEKLWDGISCKIEETDEGFRFNITSDDPERMRKLKEKLKSCCDCGDRK